MRGSKYWDDFELRAEETVGYIKSGGSPPIRRVAVFITDRCNFRCKYCNVKFNKNTMSMDTFKSILKKYGDTAVIHITGGEPSTVPWLYDFIRKNGDKYRFHLNTNAFITPPAEHVKRLKISLDSSSGNDWDCLVGKSGAFGRVVKNIKYSIPKTVVSLTYTVNRTNYMDVIEFAKFARNELNGLYALFFSIYKGTNIEFAMTGYDACVFFDSMMPRLMDELNEESRHLLTETIDEKKRLLQGERFDCGNSSGICYLSMSERVFSPTGQEYTCSHLYRDGVFKTAPTKHEKCRYGCNQRLMMFNNYVEGML